MKKMHKILKGLHLTGNFLLLLLLLGLISLPGASLWLMNYDEGNVLSSQSVRLNVTLEDLAKEDYVYDPKTDKIIKRDTAIKQAPSVSEVIKISQTQPVQESFSDQDFDTQEDALEIFVEEETDTNAEGSY